MYDIIVDILGVPSSINLSTSTIINICGALLILFAVVCIDFIVRILFNR